MAVERPQHVVSALSITKKIFIERLINSGIFKYDPDNPFVLSRGQTSDFYIDFKEAHIGRDKLVSASHLLAYYGGLWFREQIRKGQIDFGLGIPDSGNLIAESLETSSRIPALKMNKIAIGEKNPIVELDKNIPPGSRILAFENTITSGDALIRHLEPLIEQKGVKIAGIVIGVDRQEENGMANLRGHRRFRNLGNKIVAITTAKEIFAAYPKPPVTLTLDNRSMSSNSL